jgi:predicted SpoU family rRNA methylase
MKLIPVTGYSAERAVNVYVGYEGDNTQTKRREIRTAIRAWGDGLPVGGTMFGVPVAGVTSSKSCIKEVVGSVAGVDKVNRVALDTPASNADRLTALDYELLIMGNIVINNALD